MANVIRTISMHDNEEKEISNYVKQKGVSFSEFARNLLLKKIQGEQKK